MPVERALQIGGERAIDLFVERYLEDDLAHLEHEIAERPRDGLLLLLGEVEFTENQERAHLEGVANLGGMLAAEQGLDIALNLGANARRQIDLLQSRRSDVHVEPSPDVHFRFSVSKPKRSR